MTEPVKRNATRFPEDFLFRLSAQETEAVIDGAATVSAAG